MVDKTQQAMAWKLARSKMHTASGWKGPILIHDMMHFRGPPYQLTASDAPQSEGPLHA